MRRKTKLRFEAAHALSGLGFKRKQIERILKLAQPTISTYLRHKSYNEYLAYNQARNEALRTPKSVFNKRWFFSPFVMGGK